MQTSTQSANPLLCISFMVFTGLLYAGCHNTADENKPEEAQKTAQGPGVVEVVTNAMDFQVQDTIASGWTTFVYRNNSNDVHFFALEKYPEGKTLEDGRKEVVPAFQKAMDSITAGNSEAGYAAFGELPEWFTKVEFRGGSGLIGPGNMAQTTLNLEPGTYVMECYVKMPDGKFHSSMGMIRQLEITSEEGDGSIPTPTVDINISSTGGIEYDEQLEAGKHIFAVHFADQKAHENFVGHDVQLVRLQEGSDINRLEEWINWLNPKGLISPGPAGFEFLGGTQEMPAGSTAYFTATVTPGNYAFIAEVPNASEKKMLKTFTIP